MSIQMLMARNAGITFAGTSLAVKMSREKGEPDIIGVMKRKEEGMKVWEIPLEGGDE